MDSYLGGEAETSFVHMDVSLNFGYVGRRVGWVLESSSPFLHIHFMFNTTMLQRSSLPIDTPNAIFPLSAWMGCSLVSMAQLADIWSMMILLLDPLAVGKVWLDRVGLFYIWNFMMDYWLDLALEHTLGFLHLIKLENC